MCVLSLDPFLSLHDWPDELATEVMESTELAWSPSDKSNFVVLVTTTRVPCQGSYRAHLTRHPCTLLTVACHLYLSVCLCRRCP